MKRNTKIGIAYMLILAVFTGYVLADTFLISRVYGEVIEKSDASANEMTAAGTGSEETEGSDNANDDAVSQEVVSSETEYSDGNVSVTLNTVREYDTTIYVADVQLSSPEYLQTALAHDAYGRNVKEETSAIAENNNAILAINGDYYGTRETGYVIKNGTVYRDTASSGQEDLVIYENGEFGIINEDDISAEELLEKGVVQTLSFGPALVENGSISVGENEEISGKSMNSNPRTAIGIIDECHYVFVVSDGRTGNDAGLSLYQLAEVMKELGAETAYNLDGGGSSTMYFNGNIINNPIGGGAGHSSGSERSVSDIVYIGN